MIAVLTVLLACGADAADPVAPAPTPAITATAVFAGGCFWCMERPFEETPGVVSVTAGYAGGHVDNPTYKQVGTGTTGHAESIQIVYDPATVTYERLLDVYWRNVDPFDWAGQFCDKGLPYRPAIFPQDAAQKAAAEASIAAMNTRFGREVAVKIEEGRFWPAEDYHQDYYKTHSLSYAYYRTACGRDAKLESIWGDEAATHPTP